MELVWPESLGLMEKRWMDSAIMSQLWWAQRLEREGWAAPLAGEVDSTCDDVCKRDGRAKNAGREETLQHRGWSTHTHLIRFVWRPSEGESDLISPKAYTWSSPTHPAPLRWCH